MKYFLFIASIFVIPNCKPRVDSSEKWDRSKSSYLEVPEAADRYSWQYDLFRNGRALPAGSYKVIANSMPSEEEFDEVDIVPTPDGVVTKSNPNYTLTIIPVEDKNHRIENVKCNAVNRSLSGTIPLLCQDEDVDWLVDTDAGDCETPNRSSKHGGNLFNAEFNADKSVQVVLSFVSGSPILDHVESKFSEPLGLSSGRNRGLAESESNSYVPFSTNAYQAGKLISPSVIVRRENNAYRLYLIQADKSTNRAPTYLLSEFKDSDEVKTSSSSRERRTFNTKLSKNICIARLKSNGNFAEFGKAFFMLPEVPASK